MIVELMLKPFFLLIHFIVSLFPNIINQITIQSIFLKSVSLGLYFVPTPLWHALIGSVVFWMYVQMSWAVVEWGYKKIPGVN